MCEGVCVCVCEGVCVCVQWGETEVDKGGRPIILVHIVYNSTSVFPFVQSQNYLFDSRFTKGNICNPGSPNLQT